MSGSVTRKVPKEGKGASAKHTGHGHKAAVPPVFPSFPPSVPQSGYSSSMSQDTNTRAAPAPFQFDYYFNDPYSGHVYFYKNVAAGIVQLPPSLVQVLPMAIARPYMAYYDLHSSNPTGEQPPQKAPEHSHSSTNSEGTGDMGPNPANPPPATTVSPAPARPLVNFFEGDEEFMGTFGSQSTPYAGLIHTPIDASSAHSAPVVPTPPPSMTRKRSHNPYGFGPSITESPSAPSHAASMSSKSSAFLTAAASSIYSYGGGVGVVGTISSAMLAGSGGARISVRNASAESAHAQVPPPPPSALLSTSPVAASSCDEGVSPMLSRQQTGTGSVADGLNRSGGPYSSFHFAGGAGAPYASTGYSSFSRLTPVAPATELSPAPTGSSSGTGTAAGTGTAQSSSVTIMQATSRRKVITVVPSGASAAGTGAPSEVASGQASGPVHAAPMSPFGEQHCDSDSDPNVITVGVTTTLQAPEGGKKKKKNKDKKKKAAAAAAAAAAALAASALPVATDSLSECSVLPVPAILDSFATPQSQVSRQTDEVPTQEGPDINSKLATPTVEDKVLPGQPNLLLEAAIPSLPSCSVAAPPAPIGDDDDLDVLCSDNKPTSSHTQPTTVEVPPTAVSLTKAWAAAFMAEPYSPKKQSPSDLAGAPVMLRHRTTQQMKQHKSPIPEPSPAASQPFSDALKKAMLTGNAVHVTPKGSQQQPPPAKISAATPTAAAPHQQPSTPATIPKRIQQAASTNTNFEKKPQQPIAQQQTHVAAMKKVPESEAPQAKKDKDVGASHSAPSAISSKPYAPTISASLSASAVTFKNAFAALAKKEKKPMAAAITPSVVPKAASSQQAKQESKVSKGQTPSNSSLTPSREDSAVLLTPQPTDAAPATMDMEGSIDAVSGISGEGSEIDRSACATPAPSKSEEATINKVVVAAAKSSTKVKQQQQQPKAPKEDDNALLERLMNQNAIIHKNSNNSKAAKGAGSSFDKKGAVGFLGSYTNGACPKVIDQHKHQEELFGISYAEVLQATKVQCFAMMANDSSAISSLLRVTVPFTHIAGCNLINLPPLQLSRTPLPPSNRPNNKSFQWTGPIYYEEGSLIVLESLILAERLRRQSQYVGYHGHFSKAKDLSITVLLDRLICMPSEQGKEDAALKGRAEALYKYLLPFDSTIAALKTSAELLAEVERLVFPNMPSSDRPRSSQANGNQTASALVDDTEDLLDELLECGDSSTSPSRGSHNRGSGSVNGGPKPGLSLAFDSIAMLVCNATNWCTLPNDVFSAVAEATKKGEPLCPSAVRSVAQDTSPIYNALLSTLKKNNDDINNKLYKPLSPEAVASLKGWLRETDGSSQENTPPAITAEIASERDRWLVDECLKCEHETIALFLARCDYAQWYLTNKSATAASLAQLRKSGGGNTSSGLIKGKGPGAIKGLPSSSPYFGNSIHTTPCSSDISCLFFLELSQMYLDVDKGFDCCRRALGFADEYQAIMDPPMLELPEVLSFEETNKTTIAAAEQAIEKATHLETDRFTDTIFGVIPIEEYRERQAQSRYLTMVGSMFCGRYHERNVEGLDARNLLLVALKCAVTLKEPAVIARSSFILGMAVELLGKFKDALRWIQLGRVMALELRQEKWFVDYSVQMASSLGAIGRTAASHRECIYALSCERLLHFGPSSPSGGAQAPLRVYTMDEIECRSLERQTFAIDVFATALKYYTANPPFSSQTIGGASLLGGHSQALSNSTSATNNADGPTANATPSPQAASTSTRLQLPINPSVAAIYHTALVCMLGNYLEGDLSELESSAIDKLHVMPVDPFRLPYASYFKAQLAQLALGNGGSTAKPNSGLPTATAVPPSLQIALGQQSLAHCISTASSNFAQNGDVGASFLSHLEELFIHFIVCASPDWIAEALVKVGRWEKASKSGDWDVSCFTSAFPFPRTDDTGGFVQAWSYVSGILRSIGFLESALAIQTYEYKILQLYALTQAQVRRDGECLQSAATTMRIMCETGVGQVVTRKPDQRLAQGYRYLPYVPSAGAIHVGASTTSAPVSDPSCQMISIYAADTVLSPERVDALLAKGRENTRKSKLLCLNVGEHTVAAKGISELADYEAKEAAMRAAVALTGSAPRASFSDVNIDAVESRVPNLRSMPLSRLAKNVIVRPTLETIRQRLCPTEDAARLAPIILSTSLRAVASSQGPQMDPSVSSLPLAYSLTADLYRSLYAGYEASLELEKVANRQNYHVKVSVCETEWRLFDSLEKVQVQVGDLYGALKSCERRHIPNTIEGAAVLRRRSGLPVHAHKAATQRLNMAGIGLNVDRTAYPQGLTSAPIKAPSVPKFSASAGCPTDLIQKVIVASEGRTSPISNADCPYLFLTPEEASRHSMVHPTAPLTPAQQHQLLAVQTLLKAQHDRRNLPAEQRLSCDLEAPMPAHSSTASSKASASNHQQRPAAASYEELLLDTAQHYIDLKTVDLEQLRQFVEGGGSEPGKAQRKWQEAIEAEKNIKTNDGKKSSEKLLTDEQFMAELVAEVTPCPFDKFVVYSTYWSDEELIGCFVIDRTRVEEGNAFRYEMSISHRWLRLSADSIHVILNPSSSYLHLCESSNAIYDTPLFPTHVHQLSKYATVAPKEVRSLKCEFSFLYDDLIRPISDLLFDLNAPEAPKVCFVTDGFLSHLPYNALYNSNGDLGPKCHSRSNFMPFFLAEKLVITVMPSLLHLCNLISRQRQIAVEDAVAAMKQDTPSHPKADATSTVHSIITAFAYDEDIIPQRFLQTPAPSTSAITAATAQASNKGSVGRCDVRAFGSRQEGQPMCVVQHLKSPDNERVMESPYAVSRPARTSTARLSPRNLTEAIAEALADHECVLAPYCGALLASSPTLSPQQRSVALSWPCIEKSEGASLELAMASATSALREASKEAKDTVAGNCLFRLLHSPPKIAPVEGQPKLSSSTGALVLDLPCVVDLREEYCGHLCLNSTRYLASSGEIAAVWDLGSHRYPICILPTFGRFAIRAIHETSAPVYRSLLVAGVPRLMLPLWLLPNDVIGSCRQLFVDAVMAATEANAATATKVISDFRRADNSSLYRDNALPQLLARICALRFDVGIAAALRSRMLDQIASEFGDCDAAIRQWAYWSAEGLP